MTIKQAIIINAMPRTGSNILWNIIGSAHNVAMTKHEFHGALNITNSRILRLSMRACTYAPTLPLFQKTILSHIEHSRQCAIHENTQLQNKRNIDTNACDTICFKVMGGDAIFNQIIANAFENVKFIFLTRNNAGICDSYYRRNYTIKEAVRDFNRPLSFMQKTANKFPDDHLWVRYEDLMQDVEGQTEWLFKTLKLNMPENKRFLYKAKNFGKGAETSSEEAHEKILITLPELQKQLISKSPDQYLKNIPSEYWNVFNARTQTKHKKSVTPQNKRSKKVK
ncbi:MAG: sulfotransferase [Alphaproteobacteria bacterium]